MRFWHHKRSLLPYGIILATLSACASQPGVKVKTVEVVREVQKPCPGEMPERPEPIGELPTDSDALIRTLAAKLMEYAAPGMYADKAETLMRRCLD